METTNDRTMEAHVPAPPVRPRKRALGARFVALIYLLMVLAAPMIVRYGADLNPPAVVASTLRTDAAPRCASAPEFGLACKAGGAAAAPH